jgi:non-homologous end joining protein Ku
VRKGEYIELESEELEAVVVERKRTIEIDEFVPKKDINELYIRDPYYIVPDGEVVQQAFAVIREAICQIVGLGKVVFTSPEHMIALEARGKGLRGITLRYPQLPQVLSVRGTAILRWTFLSEMTRNGDPCRLHPHANLITDAIRRTVLPSPPGP